MKKTAGTRKLTKQWSVMAVIYHFTAYLPIFCFEIGKIGKRGCTKQPAYRLKTFAHIHEHTVFIIAVKHVVTFRFGKAIA